MAEATLPRPDCGSALALERLVSNARPSRHEKGRMTPLSVHRYRMFLWLWEAEGISVLGVQFTFLALPVVAVTLFGASGCDRPTESSTGPIPLLSLVSRFTTTPVQAFSTSGSTNWDCGAPRLRRAGCHSAACSATRRPSRSSLAPSRAHPRAGAQSVGISAPRGRLGVDHGLKRSGALAGLHREVRSRAR